MSSSAEIDQFFNKVGKYLDVLGKVRVLKEKLLVIQGNEPILCQICNETTPQHEVRSIHILQTPQCVVFWSRHKTHE